MFTLRHLFTTTAATGLALCVAGLPAAALQRDKSKDDDAGRPKIRLRAQPQLAMAPARITLTAELQGGADDFEEYYCAGVEWEWGDDTTSESTTDCEPYRSRQEHDQAPLHGAAPVPPPRQLQGLLPPEEQGPDPRVWHDHGAGAAGRELGPVLTRPT